MGSGTSSTATVIELRSYLMKPLSRDSFIDNFEAHYLEEIESFAALVLGQFRVMGDPDCFMWLRGYSEMSRREPSLRGFYSDEVWKRHGEISKALFLRPLTESGRRDELADKLRDASLRSQDSELRGLLVAEDRTDGWEEEAARCATPCMSLQISFGPG